MQHILSNFCSKKVAFQILNFKEKNLLYSLKYIVYLKVCKYQKQVFLKLHCPKSKRNVCKISALASKMGHIKKIRGQGRNPSKNFVCFLDNVVLKKILLRFPYLYQNLNEPVHCTLLLVYDGCFYCHLSSAGTALAQGPTLPRGKTCPWSKREISILLFILIKLKIFSVWSHPQKKMNQIMIDYIIDGWCNIKRYFQSGLTLKKTNQITVLNLILQVEKLKDCDMVRIFLRMGPN